MSAQRAEQSGNDITAVMVTSRLVAFVHLLRENGFAIGLQETQDATALLAAGYADRPSLLQTALRHLFASRKADWDRFDGLFDAFWLGKRVRSRSITKGTSKNAQAPSMKKLQDDAQEQERSSRDAQDQIASDADSEDLQSGTGRAEGASSADQLADVDFRRMNDPAQIAEAHAVAAKLARAMRARLTRRHLPRRRGERIDLRRTIRASISQGGVPLRLLRRRPREAPLRLVMLLDASGSMSMYTGIFIRFIHGVLDEFTEAEAFLFHTRLAHVSDAMKERDPARALDRLSMMAQGSGGGTRIGECLQTFNRWHAARTIHSRSCIMIVSDGYETGDAALLGEEMARLARRCRRIVWLNPMLGWDGYTPEAAGMRAALPHVDLFARANTLRSLAALEPYLARL